MCYFNFRETIAKFPTLQKFNISLNPFVGHGTEVQRVEIAATVSTFEDYITAIDKVTEGNYILKTSLSLTKEEFDQIKKAIQDNQIPINFLEVSDSAIDMAKTIVKAAEISGTAYEALKRRIVSESIAIIQANQFVAESMAASGREGFNQLIRQRGAESSALDFLARIGPSSREGFDQLTRQRGAESASLDFLGTLGVTPLEQRPEEEEQAKKAAKAAKESARAFNKAFDDMQSKLQQSANEFRSLIESQLSFTFQEVVPEDDARIDENIRRLQAVIQGGVSDPNAQLLADQFGGQEFFRPFVDALEAGDNEALKIAAENIFNDAFSRAQLVDIDLIKQRIQASLVEQQFKEEVIRLVGEDLIAASPEIQAIFSESIGEQDWGSLGEGVITGFVLGVEEHKSELYDKMREIAAGALEAGAEELEMESPSRKTFKMSENIMEGFIQGIDSKSPEFEKAILDALSIIGLLEGKGIGRGRAEEFKAKFKNMLPGFIAGLEAGTLNKSQFVNALEHLFEPYIKDRAIWGNITDRLWKNMTGAFKEASSEALKAFKDNLVSVSNAFSSFGQAAISRFNDELNTLQGFLASGQDELLWGGQILDAAQAQELLNQKLEEREQIEGDILALQRAQSDLAFLQQQLSLLDLIKESGLDASQIFAGIEFGLGASLPDLITATNRVVQALVGETNMAVGGSTMQLPASSSNHSSTIIFNGDINTGADMQQVADIVNRQVGRWFG